MTVERLREEFGQDLTTLATTFSHDIDRMQQAVRRGLMAKEYLEMNIKRAKDALRALQSFHRREFHEKLEDALEGSYRWRVAERKVTRKRATRKT